MMDHRDRIRQDRELLGCQNFSSLTLDELLNEIDQKYPTQISKKRILLLFVTWLHECLLDCLADGKESDKLKNPNPSQSDKKPQILRPRIQEWLAFLRKCHNTDKVIRDTFKEWQRDEAAKKDRDYQIKLKTIDIEFDYVLEKSPPTSKAGTASSSLSNSARTPARAAAPTSNPVPASVTPPSAVSIGYMHPERLGHLPNLRTGHVNPDTIIPSAESSFHGYIHPDRLRLSKWPQEEGELYDDDEDVRIKNSAGGWDTYPSKPAKKKRDLSFLTGSNRMIPANNKPASAGGNRKKHRTVSWKQKPHASLLTGPGRMNLDDKELLTAAGGSHCMHDNEHPKLQTPLPTDTDSDRMVLDEILPSTSAQKGTSRQDEPPNRGLPSIHPERMMMLGKMPSSAYNHQDMLLEEPPKSVSELSFLTGSNRMLIEEEAQPPTTSSQGTNRKGSTKANVNMPIVHSDQMVLDEKIPASAHNGRGLKHDEPSRVTKESGIHPDRLMILDDYKRLPAAPGKDQLSPKPESPSDLSFLTGSNRMILERSIQKPTSGTRKNLQKPLEMEDKQNLNFLTGSNRMIFDGNRPSSDPPLRAKNKNVDDDNGHQVKKPRVDDRVCGLCGGDHFLPKDCPAKMDPRDGSAPHKTYKCGICQVVGGHYTVDCPQKKGSRLEATAKHDRPSAPFVKAHLEDQRSVLRGGHSDPSLWSASARKDRHPPSSRRELIERSRGDSYRPAKDGHNHGTMSINGPPSTWEASLSRDWDTLSPNARSQENDHERNMKRVKKVEFAADLVVHSESRNDGRLSYHDEDDDTQVPLPASVKTRKARRRAREIGATLLTTPDGRHPIAEIQAHQLEDMITDMIAQESARALEAITQPPVEPANSGGIDVSQTPERDPRWDPFVLQLFKNKQIEWAFRKERPRAVNFFDLVAEVKEKLLEEPKEKGSIDGTMEVNYHQQDFTIPAPVKGTESFQDMEKVMKAEQSDEAVVDTAMDLTGVPCLEKSQIAQMSMMGSTVDSLVEYSQPTEMVASGEGEQETEAFVIDTGTDSVTVSPPAVTMGVEMPPAPAVNQEVDKINLIQTVNDSNMDFDHLPSPVPQQNSDGISTDQDGDAVMDLNDGSATAECDSAVGGS